MLRLMTALIWRMVERDSVQQPASAVVVVVVVVGGEGGG